MIAFAKHNFAMQKPTASSGNVGDHLAAAKRQGAEVDDGPDMPSELVYLWRHYRALARTRQSAGFGPLPLEWTQIEAYNLGTLAFLEAWEKEAIKAIDDAYIEASFAD